MKNVKIKTKLMIGFLGMVLLVGTVGAVGILGFRRAAYDTQHINDLGDNGMLVGRLDSKFQEQRASYRGGALKDAYSMEELAGEELQTLLRLEEEYMVLQDELESRLETPRAKELMADIKTSFAEYAQARDHFVELTRSHAEADVVFAALTALDEPVERTVEALRALLDYESATTTALAQESAGTASMLSTLLIIIVIAAVGIAIVLERYISALIAKPIVTLAAAAQRISVGDIDVSLGIDSKDEIGELAAAFDKMADGIHKQATALTRIAEGDYTVEMPIRSERDIMNQAINHMLARSSNMISEIRSSSTQVAAGAHQISQGAQGLATGSSQQAATIQEFNAVLQQILAESQENATLANEALEEANEAGRLMGTSITAMDKMSEAMSAIGESSQSITRVIKVIDDIAFQTNILALNAAVEAARAGQHGKGFAVVADEVRNLASKSADAARETAGLIESSAVLVNEGNRIVAETGESVRAVGELARMNAMKIDKISGASREQSRSIGEITAGISQLSCVVQANSATAQQSAAAAEEMSAQSTVLNGIVLGFQLREPQQPTPKETLSELPAEQVIYMDTYKSGMSIAATQ